MKYLEMRAEGTSVPIQYSSKFDTGSIWSRNDGQSEPFGILWAGRNVLMNDLTSATVIIRKLCVGRPAPILNETHNYRTLLMRRQSPVIG